MLRTKKTTPPKEYHVIVSFGGFAITRNSTTTPMEIVRASCKSAFANFMAAPSTDTFRTLRLHSEALLNAVADEKHKKS